MTKYLGKAPIPSMPTNQNYADGWDRIFAPKPAEQEGPPEWPEFARKNIEAQNERLGPVGSNSNIESLVGKFVNFLRFTVQDAVRQFHTVFGQPIVDKPTVPPDARVRLRSKLICEEFLEFLEATFDCEGNQRYLKMREDLEDMIAGEYPYARLKVKVDMVETADALTDLAYVVEGANLEYGIKSAEVLAEVHASNLSKLGEDGKPVYREDGKATKGPNYAPPDIEAVLRRQGWDG